MPDPTTLSLQKAASVRHVVTGEPMTMPPRQPSDGPVAVHRRDDERIEICATTDGKDESIVVGQFNAWRLYGMLGAMLGLPHHPSVGKAIKL